jgi:hypothetical protein
MNSLQKIINESKGLSITVDVLTRMTFGVCNVFVYDQIIGKSINQMFGDKRSVIVLYQPSRNNIGHFICMCLNDENMISLFDSYGEKIDKEIVKDFDNTWILKAIAMSGKKYEINNVQYQKLDSDIGTCGRYALLRAMLYKLTNAQFEQLLKSKINVTDPDTLVSMLTFMIDLYNEHT